VALKAIYAKAALADVTEVVETFKTVRSADPAHLLHLRVRLETNFPSSVVAVTVTRPLDFRSGASDPAQFSTS
jgi:hypothetical protein